MSALKMFAKLFFVRDPQEMVRLVVGNLYPAKYLEEPDEKGNESSNRDRIVKVRNVHLHYHHRTRPDKFFYGLQEFLYRYDLTRRQPIMGRILQSAAAMWVHHRAVAVPLLTYSSLHTVDTKYHPNA